MSGGSLFWFQEIKVENSAQRKEKKKEKKKKKKKEKKQGKSMGKKTTDRFVFSSQHIGTDVSK